MSAASGSEPVAVFAELRFVDFAQHLRDRLLDHPIQHRWYAEGAERSPTFGNEHTAHR